MHQRIKSLVANFLLAAVSIIIVLGATELFLRAFPRYMPPLARLKLHWISLPATVSHADRYTGFLYPANAQKQVHAGEVNFTYHTDSLGFRNSRSCGPKSDVVVIGDSEVFGFGVNDQYTWTSLLSNQLPHTCITNLGLPGMAPRQYLRTYRRFGVPRHPALLIFGLFPGNDLGDEHQFETWLEAGSPGNYDTWRFFGGRPPSLNDRVTGLLQHSYLYWFLGETRRNLRQRAEPAPPPVQFPDGSRIHLSLTEFRGQVKFANPDDSVFQAVMTDIERAQRLAAENGTRFLVILLATKEDVYLPLRGQAPPPMLPAFRAALEQARIPFLDLSVPMQQATRAVDVPLFFKVDGHPNAAGYRVIADAVLAELRRHAASYGIPDLR
jgi:lysophospholipase L1-like esterase